MPRLIEGLIRPTPEENAEINRGIALDPDTWELTDEDFKKMKPYAVWMSKLPRAADPSAE